MATTSNPFGGRGNITIGDSAAAGPGLMPHPHQTLANSLFDKGILKDTLLPSATIHGGLAVLAYAAGRATDRLESKDWLWPTAQVANAWWASVGRRLIAPGASATVIFSALSRPERLILAGVTLWGGRLAYRLARRSAERGHDDPRYAIAKKEEGFWNKAFFNVYLPEAALQSIITLTFTAPFNHQGAVLTGYHPLLQAVAVGLFGTGFALEVLADWQLDEFKKRAGSQNAMCREGVWSLVRHPNYLGDMLVHLSFPVLLYASDMLAPIELLGPLAYYVYLRFIGGDKETERHQVRRYSQENPVKMHDFDQYRKELNSFWPDTAVLLQNQWAWIVLGCGVGTAAMEHLLRKWI